MTPQVRDAVVVGGGIAGLSAAWQLCQAGLRPLLVEARGYTGGLVAAAEVGGARTDLGAEGFVMRGQAVTEMVDALGLTVTGPSGGGASLFLPPLDDEPSSAGWARHPFLKDSFLGIPAHPLAEDAVAVLGQAGAERAAADATLPGTVGTQPGDPADLASFVRARMGQTVLDRLVRPIVAGIHTSDPTDLAADTVAPGLREATARLGSLQAAVTELIEHRRARRRAGQAADVTTHGGLTTLTDALREAVTAAGGQVLTRTGAQSLRPAPDAPGSWDLEVAPTVRGATPSSEPVPTGPSELVRTSRLVLACSAGAAQRLLAGAGTDTAIEVPVGSPIARVMLVVRSEELDAAPVGSGLLVAPVAPGQEAASCPVSAKALSHLSVKWPWIGEQLAGVHGPHVHALRLSYGRPGEPRPEISLDQALEDVTVLTGLTSLLRREDVIAHTTVRWDGTLPPVTPAYRERTARLVDDVATLPGLAVTGAWVAGTGIATVVEHARTQAARLSASLQPAPAQSGLACPAAGNVALAGADAPTSLTPEQEQA
ncbi:protoporphyrinogen/coproporphyrinogen oxidase [Actinomyces faecalis]|uniref:protoporphyrinogen/coproporphyrinogen oxidase n=1 Tax=Actinomyces faecalis TaxID=2722820 RepID=UPI0015560400|nr:FAD-dependent oxidoreductase [Actinomyces faecalis]